MKGTGVQSVLENWLKKPFAEDMDAGHWALFLGFAIIVSLAWRRVIALILDNA